MARGAVARGKAGAKGALPRRVPQQERSRARVDAILRSTIRLVGEGRDVSVREIAEAAKVPIASVYQYFPDKTALLHAILREFYAGMRLRMERALSHVGGIQDIPTFADAMIDELVAHMGDPEQHFNLFAASQAQQVLRELDVNEALELANLVTDRLLSVGPVKNPEGVRDLCIFAVVMAGPVVRQSFVLPRREGQRLVRELKVLIRLRASGLS